MECLLIIDPPFFSILSPEVHTLNLHTLVSHRTLSSTLMYGSSAVQTVLHATDHSRSLVVAT